jgi:hypothetical protein
MEDMGLLEPNPFAQQRRTQFFIVDIEANNLELGVWSSLQPVGNFGASSNMIVKFLEVRVSIQSMGVFLQHVFQSIEGIDISQRDLKIDEIR